jgi:hypothetical protein
MSDSVMPQAPAQQGEPTFAKGIWRGNPSFEQSSGRDRSEVPGNRLEEGLPILTGDQGTEKVDVSGSQTDPLQDLATRLQGGSSRHTVSFFFFFGA